MLPPAGEISNPPHTSDILNSLESLAQASAITADQLSDIPSICNDPGPGRARPRKTMHLYQEAFSPELGRRLLELHLVHL